MNERIKELAEQAITEKLSIDEFIEALKKEPYDFYGFRVSELQKFAELIVAECMTTVLNESKWYWDKDEFESSNAIQNAARRVKEHFGVEE